ncbi:NAD(P)-dependent dehydrogenase (short-subunit alcohol dehydrogenase family) [Nocardioides aromaticivorans]|uniref:NAD(P)-dependent dehydrogenase (Short-subunit alcohol dehydrogenase family) n=1 Tax=Nocardioides aromaticivorans TaxID=200618 RepID=A0A7Z0CQS1_9ACTN|nr:SDR family oxidoreductase [Nocardioides aromaticivorans]NYI47117.1 NAD(P)-dependent dehydrogenase (short-subunit alcohol dehydrogenase family) [Nocardioides aromaticivorans]
MWFRAPVRDLAGKQVLVTGAASGIGRAVAEYAAARGAVLHLTDLQGELLTEVAEAIRAGGGEVATAEAADVSDHAQVRDLARGVTERSGPMDVVLNVAGIAVWGTVRSLEPEHWQRLVDVNLMGPIHVIEEFLPPMIDGGRGGQLVNVSSAAGIIAMPWHAAYSATKFGLRGVSEVLRYDLRKHRIGVSLVCPGGVDTGLVETIRIAGIDQQSRSFVRARRQFQKRAVSPQQAAESIWRGALRNRYWVYTSPDIRLVHWLQRYFPPGYAVAMRVFNYGANRVLPAVEQARRSDLA